MEEIKSGLSDELKCYMGEERVESAHELTILADEHALTHRKGNIWPMTHMFSEGRIPTEG